ELDAFVRMFDRSADAVLHHPHAAGGEAHPTVIEDAHRDLEAHADAADDIFNGNLHVVEKDRVRPRSADAELMLLGSDANAFGGKFENEARDFLVGTF